MLLRYLYANFSVTHKSNIRPLGAISTSAPPHETPLVTREREIRKSSEMQVEMKIPVNCLRCDGSIDFNALREDFEKGLELKAEAANLRMGTVPTHSSYYIPYYEMARVCARIVIIVSYVSSKHLSSRMQSHTGCIWIWSSVSKPQNGNHINLLCAGNVIIVELSAHQQYNLHMQNWLNNLLSKTCKWLLFPFFAPVTCISIKNVVTFPDLKLQPEVGEDFLTISS